MLDLLQIFRAGFVHRWHTNPDLAHTRDRIDGHSARVARIILALHPAPSLDLIRAALIHDDGESVVGDIKAPFKGLYPVISDALAEVETHAVWKMWGHDERDIMGIEGSEWLKFADRLDAYMWAALHAPHILTRDGWPEVRADLLRMACQLDPDGPLERNIHLMLAEMEVRRGVA